MGYCTVGFQTPELLRREASFAQIVDVGVLCREAGVLKSCRAGSVQFQCMRRVFFSRKRPYRALSAACLPPAFRHLATGYSILHSCNSAWYFSTRVNNHEFSVDYGESADCTEWLQRWPCDGHKSHRFEHIREGNPQPLNRDGFRPRDTRIGAETALYHGLHLTNIAIRPYDL